jgi:hypothetical protein
MRMRIGGNTEKVMTPIAPIRIIPKNEIFVKILSDINCIMNKEIVNETVNIPKG